MVEKFWETGTKLVDFEDTRQSSPTFRLLAKLVCPPLFFFAAVVVPIGFLLSSDAETIFAGIFCFSFVYALVPLAIYAAYVEAHTEYTLRISTADGIIEEIVTRIDKDKVERTVYPIKEVLRISLSDPCDGEGGGGVSIRGMNIRGVRWGVDLSKFAWERYKQGERSSDHRRIAYIKTAEYFAEMLDVEIGSSFALYNVSRHVRLEFGHEWINKWSLRDTIKEQYRRLLDEENQQR
ncbi:MAG: hypothetical protein ACPGSA_05510 [Poseidonia sp.]